MCTSARSYLYVVLAEKSTDARANGLTPFSVYQGQWNAAICDVEAEIVPLCEDQGVAIVSWGSLGRGHLASKEQGEKLEKNPDAPKKPYGKQDIAVCDAVEKITNNRKTTFQAVALAYLFHQSTNVFSIVGVQTVEHVDAMEEALKIRLEREEVVTIQDAAYLNPIYPNTFMFSGDDSKGYTCFCI